MNTIGVTRGYRFGRTSAEDEVPPLSLSKLSVMIATRPDDIELQPNGLLVSH
jgi:hypothetical protein